MGGDDGENTSGETGNSTSGEVTSESDSETEVSEVEVSEAFGESENGDTKGEIQEQSVETSGKDSETKDISVAEATEVGGKCEISESEISELPENVQESYNGYESQGWVGPLPGATEGTRAGGEWSNRDGELPVMDAKGNEITYQEFDVNNKPIDGTFRDGERFVRGSDGSVYYTSDHYLTFTKIK